MKKLLLFLLMVCLSTGGVFAFEDIFVEERPPQSEQVITPQVQNEPEVIFNWADLTKNERIELANSYRDVIFSDSSKIYLTKDEFKKEFEKYKKDKNFKYHYMLANNGVTEDEDAKYSPFYYKKNTLIIYAIQYRDDIHHSLYYTAFGKLYYADITSENYPKFPYYSMQYDKKGNLKSALYFASKDIQYMYDSKKEFQGVWYKSQMFDLDGKQISTREGW